MQRVKEVSRTYFIKHLNENKQTPEELFAATYYELYTSATDWLKRTSENCTIIAVLITTVAFAATYIIPGGPNKTTGLHLPTILCDLHLDRRHFPHFLFNLSCHIPLNPPLLVSITRLQELSSSEADVRFHILNPFGVNDDGGIFCDDSPRNT